MGQVLFILSAADKIEHDWKKHANKIDNKLSDLLTIWTILLSSYIYNTSMMVVGHQLFDIQCSDR